MRDGASPGRAAGPSAVLAALMLVGLAPVGAWASGERVVPLGFELPPGSSPLPDDWRHVEFPSVARTTSYAISRLGGRVALHALASSSASFVIRRAPERLGLLVGPRLRWSWRVEKTVLGGDGRSRKSDDFAARVWVGFETDWSTAGWFERREADKARERYGFEPPGFWIHYVWSGRGRAQGETFDEPYRPDRFKCVALRNDADPLATWLDEERDPRADFERLFGRVAPRITAVAVMTDGDDSGVEPEAWYADLAFVSSG